MSAHPKWCPHGVLGIKKCRNCIRKHDHEVLAGKRWDEMTKGERVSARRGGLYVEPVACDIKINTCGQCRGLFVLPKKKGGKQKYCGLECRDAASGARANLRKSTVTEKCCGRCNVTKPIAALGNRRVQRGASWQPWCRPCIAKYAKEVGRAHKYGLTVDELRERLRQANGRCAGCGLAADLAIDHDHSCCPGGTSCGRCVRDLLCFACNGILGQADDDPDRLRALADYIERHRRKLHVA